MTLPVILYALFLGTLVAGAAHFLDLALRSLRRPSRWIWATALAGTTVPPLVILLFPWTGGKEPPQGAGLTLEALYATLGHGSHQAPSFPPGLAQVLDTPLLWGWIVSSLSVFLLFLGATVRLRRRAETWAVGKAAEEEVLLSDGLGPAVLGLLKPRIILPPWAFALESGKLEMILLHEGEHRRARDPALLTLGVALVGLAPWNPAAWWIFRRLRLAVEGDCDARVLARGVSRKEYGNLLLGMVSVGRGTFPLAPALAEGSGSFLERRLRMMKTRVGRTKAAGVAFGTAAGGLLLALACETPTPPPSASGVEEAEMAVELRDGTSQLPQKVLIRESDGAVPGEKTAESGAFKLRPLSEGDGGPALEPLIYIDGVRVEGGKEAIADLDPDAIDRIEVVKGPAAEAVLGEEAAGGVIQIFLKILKK